MGSPGRSPQRSMQPEKMVYSMQFQLDAANAPTFLQGENHSATNLPLHNSTGDYTIFLQHTGVALLTAKAWLRFPPLAGVHPALGKATEATVIIDTGTDITGATSPGAKVHVQTWNYATGIPTKCDPEAKATLSCVLELELVVACSSVASQ